jgi:predicted nucleic acid-binding protein
MSDIGAVEVIASLARRGREGSGLSSEFAAAIHHFQADFEGRWVEVRTTHLLLAKARAYAIKHFLRGYDAVHLAAAINADEALRASRDVSLVFVSSDKLPNTAARAEGLRVVDPTERR